MKKLVFNSPFLMKFQPFKDVFFNSQSIRNWDFFLFRRKLNSTELWAHRTIRRGKRYTLVRKNYRIFFSKRNKLFKNLSFMLEFNKFGERKKRLKRQLVFLRWLRALYGLKRASFFTSKMYLAKMKNSNLIRLEVLLQLLERQLLIVLVRMIFVLNNAWGRYTISRGMIFLNGLRILSPTFLVSLHDLISVQVIEYLNPFTLSKSAKESNLYKYCMWLLLKTSIYYATDVYKNIKKLRFGFFGYYAYMHSKYVMKKSHLSSFFLINNKKLKTKYARLVKLQRRRTWSTRNVESPYWYFGSMVSQKFLQPLKKKSTLKNLSFNYRRKYFYPLSTFFYKLKYNC